MAGEQFAHLMERIDRGYKNFCVNVFDISGESSKYLTHAGDPHKYTTGTMVRDSLSDMGIHSRQGKENYNNWYKDQTPNVGTGVNPILRQAVNTAVRNGPEWYGELIQDIGSRPARIRQQVRNSPLSRAYRGWQKEARRLADHGIHVENAGEYTTKQLRELRKIATVGYDIEKLKNPELSPLDMRMALPYLMRNDVEFTHESILDLRRKGYELSVDSFISDMTGRTPSYQPKKEEEPVAEAPAPEKAESQTAAPVMEHKEPSYSRDPRWKPMHERQNLSDPSFGPHYTVPQQQAQQRQEPERSEPMFRPQTISGESFDHTQAEAFKETAADLHAREQQFRQFRETTQTIDSKPSEKAYSISEQKQRVESTSPYVGMEIPPEAKEYQKQEFGKFAEKAKAPDRKPSLDFMISGANAKREAKASLAREKGPQIGSRPAISGEIGR